MSQQERGIENEGANISVGRINLMDELWAKFSPKAQMTIQLTLYGILFLVLMFFCNGFISDIIHQSHIHGYAKFFAMMIEDPTVTTHFGVLVMVVLVMTGYFVLKILNAVVRVIVKYKC